MNDEKLTGANEYNTGGRRLADLDQEQNDSPKMPADSTSGEVAASRLGAPTEYDTTAVGSGHTATGTTNTTVDAGGATQGMGTTETGPGGSTTMGSGDSMDDSGSGPLGMDGATLRAMGGDGRPEDQG